jgi:hypothetical protein
MYACSKFDTELQFNINDLFEQEREEPNFGAHVKTDSGLLVPKNLITKPRYNSDINVAPMGEGTDEDTDTSLSDIINKVLNSGVPVAPDLRVDDRDIEKPKNIVEWITDGRFIGGDDEPFGKQVQIMAHTLGEWCPRCSDEDYFENVPVKHRYDDIRERVVFLENGVCPKCRRNKIQLMDKYDLKDPDELVAVMGQRSGKTISATMIESYNLCKWLTMPNIPTMYNIKSSTIISFTYTATTFNQVKENFWMPYDTLITGSDWFKQYHRFLDELGYKYGEELYKHSETILVYRHKNMFSSCASPSMRALRGRTRGGAGIDEYGWMKGGKTKSGQTSEMMNGLEVYTSLKRSLTTLRSAYRRLMERGYFNAAKPLMTLISSPSARNDPIMTRYRESQGSKVVYVCKYPTWEVNPGVPRKDLDEDFRIRPIESERDFACNPPMAASPWIADEELVEQSFSGNKNLVVTHTRRRRTRSRKLVTAAEFKPAGKLRAEYGGVMGIDAGWNNNSFAIAIAYPTSVPEPEDEDEEDIFVGVSIPLLIEIIPKSDYPISFSAVYREVIKPLCEQYNVAAVASDRWQNKKIMDDLDDALGLETFEIKLTLKDFDDYKQCLYDELIEHPKLDMPMERIVNMSLENYPDCFSKTPVAHLAFQMLTVQNSGNAIVKGEDGTTDDILRACVVAHSALQDRDILDICLEYSNDDFDTAPVIGTYAGLSGGSTNVTSAGNIGVSVSRSGGGSRGASSSAIGVIGTRRR